MKLYVATRKVGDVTFNAYYDKAQLPDKLQISVSGKLRSMRPISNASDLQVGSVDELAKLINHVVFIFVDTAKVKTPIQYATEMWTEFERVRENSE